MDEKYIQDLYDHLGGQTKFGKFDDFKELISSDPTYRKQFHDSFGDKQLGSYDDFESLVKKKGQDGSNVSATPLEATSSNTPNLETEIPLVDIGAARPEDNTFQGNTPGEDDIIGQAQYADELRKRTKTVAGRTMPDEEAAVYAGSVEKGLEAKGYDAKKIAQDFTGIPDYAFSVKGLTKPELLEKYKSNKPQYERNIATAKAQSALRDELYKLPNGRQLWADVVSSYNAAGVGDAAQQRENLRRIVSVANSYGGEKSDEIVKNLGIDFSNLYGKESLDVANIEKDPKSAVLNNIQLGAWHLLEDTKPNELNKYKAALLDDKDIKDNPEAKLQKQEAGRQLELLGATLQKSYAQEKLNPILKEYTALSDKAAKEGLTPIEQQRMVQLEHDGKPFADIIQQVNDNESTLTSRYPMSSYLDANNFAQELVGQKHTGLGWLAAETGKATENTAKGIWDIVSEPFRSDENSNLHQAEILGSSNLSQNSAYLKQENQLQKSFKPELSEELQKDIDAIKNDPSLSDSQKLSKASDLLMSRAGEWRRSPVENGETNIGLTSLMYGVGGLAANLAPFVLGDLVTGGGVNAGALKKFSSMFTSAAATSFHDAYVDALKRGEENPFAHAARVTAINSAALAGADAPAAIRKMIGGETAIGKLVSKMTDDEIAAALKESPKALTAFGKSLDAIKKTGGQIANTSLQSFKSGAKIAGITTAGQAVNDAIDKELKSPIDYAKQAAIETLKFGVGGTMAGIAGRAISKPTEMNLAAISEAGKNPEPFLMSLETMEKNGSISPEQAQQVRTNIEKANKIFKSSPILNNPDITDKVKREYLYNTWAKKDIQESMAEMPPKMAEKAEHDAMVLDYKNDILLNPPTDKQLESRQATLEKQIENKDEDGKPLLNDKEIAKAKAQLEAVKQTIEARQKEVPETKTEEVKSSTTAKNIDAQVEEINKRRQEEFKTLPKLELETIAPIKGDFSRWQVADFVQRAREEKNVSEKDKEKLNDFLDKFIEIDNKYDAEIAALPKQDSKSSTTVSSEVEFKDEGLADEPTSANVTERTNQKHPFIAKISDALRKLGILKGNDKVIGGQVQGVSKNDGGGFTTRLSNINSENKVGDNVGELRFNGDGSIRVITKDGTIHFDKNGNPISHDIVLGASDAKDLYNKLEGSKQSIIGLEKIRDSDDFKYKTVEETDGLGNRKKVKRLKTNSELSESTKKINDTINKAKEELKKTQTEYDALPEHLKAKSENKPIQNEPIKEVKPSTTVSSGVEGSVGVGGGVKTGLLDYFRNIKKDSAFDELVSIGENMGIGVKEYDGDSPLAANFNGTDVTINKRFGKPSTNNIAHEVIHGILHKLTSNEYKGSSLDVKLQKFKKELFDYIDNKGIDNLGLKPELKILYLDYIRKSENSQEIVTFAFTNGQFHNFLSSIKSEGVANKSKTLWGKLKDIFKSTLQEVGIKSKLDDLVDLLDSEVPLKAVEQSLKETTKAETPTPSQESNVPEKGKSKAWYDFISYNRTQEISQSLRSKSYDELKTLLDQKIKRRDSSVTPKNEKQRLRQEVWDIQDLVNAHEKANEFNQKLKEPIPETAADGFDFEKLINEQKSKTKEQLEKEAQDEINQEREAEYQKSSFDKRWAKTYQEAKQKLIEQYNKAKKTKEEWESKKYKSAGDKSVFVGGELEGNDVSVDRINQRRKENAIKNAQSEMDSAKKDLAALGLTDSEIKKALSPQESNVVEGSGGVGGDVEAKINKVADEYLYHGTGEGAFRRIREEGLTPQGEKYLYFADKEQYAKTYAQRKGNSFGDRVLRVKKSDAYLPDENTTGGDFKIKNKINPNDIEIKHNGKWIPIQEFADENIGIMPISKAVEESLKPQTENTKSNEEQPTNADSGKKAETVAEISPNKNVSASKVSAIKDLIAEKYSDLKEMEAGILANLDGKEPIDDLMEYVDWNRTTQKGGKWKGKGLKGSAVEKLIEKGYVEEPSFMDENITLTDKGKKFQEALKARQETRKGIKAGTDLFPKDAGLSGKELVGDALDRIANKIGGKKNLTEQERTSLTKDISDLAKGLIQMGSATLDNVIDKIKEAIKKRVPELDDKEVDALANNIEDDVIFKATIDEFKELGLSYEEAKSLLDEDNIDYSEQELKDAWGEEPDDSITPPFDDEKQLQTSDGKLREKAVLNKAYDGEKRDEIKAKIEELNLMYEVENQESVVKKVNDLIEEIGIDAAYESVKNNKDKNAVDAVIFDAKIRSVESEMATATGDRYEELITEQARLYDEMGAVGKDMGRFISMLGHIYRTTDLAYSFARQKELYKSVNNGDFPKAIEIKYRELEEAMKSAQRRISELEKEKKEIEDNYNGAINKDEVNKLIAEAYKSGKNSKKKRNIYSQRKEKVERAKKQIAEGLEDFAKAMGSILSAEGLERPSLTKALVKIGKGLIDGGFATVENVFDKIKDNIKDKFGDTVDIENYKDDVNNALSENSKIKIPNSKIKDIVARRRELGLDTKIEDVVKELQEEYPDYSERDIRDAVSGYGVTKELKPGDDATVRKIKRMGRYESILEDILNEKRPLRTGTQRDKIEADERAKLKEIYQKLKNLPVDATDLSKQLKTAQDAIVAHLENSIEDLDRQIKTGERPEKNKPLETTPEIDALRKRRDELLSIRNNIDNPPKSDLEKLVEKAIDFTNKINQAKKEGKKQDEEWLKKQKELTDGSISNLIDTVIKLNTNPQEVELARKVKAKENEILKLQEKLDNNDLSKQEQKQTITSPELDALIEQKRLLTDELAQRRKSDEEGNLYTNTVNKLQELSDKSADKKIPKEAVKSGLISDLIESYINNGTPLAEIQEKVVNELSSIFPNSDVLQIRDAILRQGDYKTVTKEMSDLRKKIAEFKIQLNLQKKVENARQGVIDIAKTKGESSPELIKARKELAQARKEAVDRFPSASIKNIEKNIRQTQNRINEINRKTKAGEFEKKKQAKKMFMNDPAWKAKFDELKQKNIEKIKAQYKFDLEQEKARMKNRSIPRKSFDFIVDLLGLPKSLVATIDLSAPLRQGIGLGVYNPKEFFKAFWHMHGFATSQKKYDKFFNALKSTEEYHIMTQSGLSITNTTGKADAREDVFMNNLAKKIPIYGIFYKGSERAYSGFLNMLRIDVFNKGVEHLKLQGITFEENPEQYEALARTINNATGRGELGATGEKIARELGLVFFSPRMLTSRVGMVSDIFRPDTPKYARTVAFGNAIGLASYIMTIHALGALIMSAADDEEKGVTFKEVMEKLSFNIIDTDFLKNTYPGKNTKGETTKYDFSTGFSILLRTIARMSVGKKIVRSRRTGEKEERSLRDGGAYRESGADEFFQFIKNKLSPTARVIYSLPVFANQDLEDYKEKFEWVTALKSLVAPLNVKEALGEDNFEWQKKDYHGIPYYSPKTIKGSDWDINQEKYWTDRILSAYGVSIMTY